MTEPDSPTPEPPLPELADLPPTAAPPPALEDRVVAALAARGLVRRPPRRVPPWLVAAACLAAAAVGWVAHDLVPPASSADGSAFLLLLSEPRPLATDAPTAELAAEYRRWAATLPEGNRVVHAARLLDTSRHLARRDGDIVTSRGASAAPPTGFFVVRATDLDAAVAVARSAPHLAYGGEITVRPLAPANGRPVR